MAGFQLIINGRFWVITEGINADDAGPQLTVEFKTKYSDWPINNLTNFVKSIYAE